MIGIDAFLEYHILSQCHPIMVELVEPFMNHKFNTNIFNNEMKQARYFTSILSL